MTRPLGISLALLLLVFLAYWPAVGNHFVSLDDETYVTGNPHVKGGLTGEGVDWAFTSLGYAGNWHPLTWLSHMLDVELFGLNPRGHHLVSIGLHASNAVLLFLVLRGMTGALGRSALVAALFALHPLHVESVVWVAERKDVLSTFFGLLTMAAYGGYVRQRSLGRYGVLLGLFALGLLAKPMLVTLPFVFLLLDYWPLDRVRPPPPASRTKRKPAVGPAPPRGTDPEPKLSLVLEKLPLFALAALSAGMTWAAQSRGWAVNYRFPLWDRLSNALVAYVAYLGKTVWPVNLAAFYPLPESGLPVGRVLAAGFILGAVTALVLWQRRRYPYLVTGWFWYLGTLVPVIGLVQVGSQAMADRYTYIPLIGIFILLAWSLPAFELVSPGARTGAIGGGALLLAGLMALTWVQTTYWRDDQALFGHALAVTRGNWLAHNNLGAFYSRMGRDDEAYTHFKEALRLRPDMPDIHFNIGEALQRMGRLEEAAQEYRTALRLYPGHKPAQTALWEITKKIM